MLVKLKDIATFINGRAYLMPELQNAGKYRIVRVGNFSGKDEWFYSDMELDPEKYCEKGDLLYKWACNFGPEIWKEEKAIYHYHIWKVIPDESKVNKFYLYYKLAFMTPYWLSSTNGSTMVHITKEIMENKTIELPNIDTQNKIAKILTRLDTQIERNETIVKRLQVLAQTIFYKFYGDNIKNFNGILSDLCSLPSGYSFKPSNYVENGKYKLITIKNVNGSFVDTKNVDTINDIPNNMKSFCYLNIGDILVSLTGNVGRISINSSLNCLLNQRVSKLIFKDNKYRLYIYLLLNSEYYQEKMKQMANGTSQKNLSPLDVEKLRIFIPDNIDEFYKFTKDILDQLCLLNLSSTNLNSFKIKLLPLLINGQIQ